VSRQNAHGEGKAEFVPLRLDPSAVAEGPLTAEVRQHDVVGSGPVGGVRGPVGKVWEAKFLYARR
jgi:hypothetical protein